MKPCTAALCCIAQLILSYQWADTYINQPGISGLKIVKKLATVVGNSTYLTC